MQSKIWLSSPHMCGLEQKFVTEAFETNWIAPLGPNVTEFENDLQSYFSNKKYVTALSSGTAAIHLGLILLGVKKEDEVLCQSKTFSASANPIAYQGATPVFVDSENFTYNLCPEQLEIAIKDRIERGKKPKAIIAVHLYGMPYQVKEIHAVADKYDIPILEDSAEALGSHYNGENCGSFGRIAILSFNGNKIITTSGGGALITREKEIKDKAIHLATQARDDRPEYHHTKIGYNYRLSNVTAGIGRGQLSVLADRVRARRSNFQFYKSNLEDFEVEFNLEPEGSFSNRWLSTILLKDYETREDLRIFLEKQNIESRPFWKPMHMQPVFKYYPSYTNGISEDLYNRGLCLPSGSNLSEEDLDRVSNSIKNFFKQL